MKGLVGAWPKQMSQKFKDLNALAEYCFPNGAEVYCPECRVERHASVAEIAGWLANGFPRCRKCSARIEIRNPHMKKVSFE